MNYILKLPAIISISFLLCLQPVAKGQLAVIESQIKEVKVKEEPEKTSKRTGILFSGDIVLFMQEKDTTDWIEIYYDEESNPHLMTGQKSVQGYVYRSQIKPINDLPHIPFREPNRKEDTSALYIYNDSIHVQLELAPFIPQNHKIQRDASGNIRKIDGNTPIGTDGTLPTTYIKNMSMVVRGKRVEISKEAYKDLFQPGLSSFNVYFGANGVLYLYMPLNSDGAGGYLVAWKVQNGKYSRRYVYVP